MKTSRKWSSNLGGRSQVVLRAAAAAAVACTFASAPALAVDYTWSSSSAGGLWSGTTNWTPNGTVTGTANTATLGNATADRTVTFDNNASISSIGSILFTQTSAFTNLLEVQKDLTVSNTITLGASNGGLAKLLVSPVSGTTATNATLTASVLINSGGQLSLGAYNPSGTSAVGTGILQGAVTIAGGALVIEPLNKQGSATGGNAAINGALTMTSGTLAYNTGGLDRRLQVQGNVSITGGALTGTAGVIEFYNTTNIVFAPQSFDTRIGLMLYGAQTFSGSTAIGNLNVRGNGTKTVSNSASIGSLVLFDAGGTGTASAPLKLASNITTTSAPIAATYSQTIDSNGGLDFAVDADRYTLDFSSANAVWAPTKQPTGNAANTNTTWTLTGTAGTLKATGFNFSTSGTSVLTTNVGPGLVLLATGGTSANVLSGSGTIDSTSIFRFSGTTTVSGTPATLASTRSIGDVEVTSGALRITSLAGAQALRVTGGALDLNSSGYTFSSARLAGGAIQSGTLTSAGLFDLQSGTASAVLAGSGSVSKTTTGTVTLSGNNTYSGTTTITAGVLQIGSSGTTGSLGTGAVANNANLTFSRTDNYGGSVTNAIAGTGSLTLASGTLTLSGSNGYTGLTSLSGGVLALGTSSALAGGGTISFGGGTLQFSSGNTQDYSDRIKSSGSAISIDTNSQGVAFGAALDSTNTGGLTKLGSGTLAVTNSNTYLGTTTISAGVLQVGSSGTTGSLGTGAVANNANLTFSRTDDYGGAVANTMSGTGSLTLSSGTLTLSGGTANTFSGLTTVSGGALQLNKTAGVNAVGGNVLVNAGGTLRLSAANQIADTGTVTLVAGTWNLNGQNETITSLSGTASGGTAPTVTLGSGTLSLNSISYTGAAGSASTSFGAGTLRFVPNGATQPSFTTNYQAGVNISSAVQIDAASVSFNLNTYGTLISGRISGTGALIKSSQGGSLTLSGSNDYSGGTQWTSTSPDWYQFSANASGALGTGTVTLSGGSQVTYTNQSGDPSAFIFAGGTTTQANAFKLAATSVISVSNPKGTQATTDAVLLTGGFDLGGNTLFVRGLGTGTISGPITGSGGITKIDALGTWALTGTNTFSGATTISNGILSFGGTSALGSTSGVTINGGAGLTYTGGADTFSRNITITPASGTGTIRNSGGGLLTLSGSLSKDNSVLRLTGGRFNVTGTISGTTVGASDLLVDGTSTVTLSAVNTYSGPTFVNQASNLILGVNNAIPSTSAVTLGNATTTGTLTLGSFSNSIGQLVFSGAGGTLAISAATTASVQLVTGSSLSLGSNARLDLTGSGTTAGLYRLVSASAITGTFASVTGLDSNYVLRYGTVNANEIDAQRKADQSATFTMTTGGVTRALVNTSVAVSGTVTNSSPANSTALTLGLSSTGLTGSGFTTGSVAGGSSLAVSGTLATGTTAGTQNWTIRNIDNNAITGTSTATGSLQVVNQRSFTITGGTIALGNFLRTVGASGSATVSSSGLYDATATASLAAFSGTNTNGFGLSLASGSANFAGAEALQQAVYALSGSAATAGAIDGGFTSSVTAEFGSITPLSVLLSGTALDPATAQLASGGTVDGTNWTINLGEFNQGSGTSSPFLFGISNLEQAAGFTADLFLASITNPTNSGAIFTDLTGTSAFGTLAAGGTNSFSAWMSLATTGSFTNVYNLAFNSSKNNAGLGGTPQNVTLTVTGVIVVPEPGALVLAGIGMAAGWVLRRRLRAA